MAGQSQQAPGSSLDRTPDRSAMAKGQHLLKTVQYVQRTMECAAQHGVRLPRSTNLAILAHGLLLGRI